uniref:Uncharacterized protein n=1 Tax=Strix occidentalis caurina TaxID=311401 RepID=A0A8D0KT97_STROC
MPPVSHHPKPYLPRAGAPPRAPPHLDLHSPRLCSSWLLWFSRSTIQDGGEEVEEGAVYHVTLKRVQIQQAANKGARWLGLSAWVI